MFQSRNNQSVHQDPDPEVVPRAKRRQYSESYKKQILEEYDTCTEPGGKGALLRREGIYYSYITTWKKQQNRDELLGSTSKRRGPKTDPKEEKISRLENENRRLRERLRKAELIIETQKKSLRSLVYRRTRTTSGVDPGSGGFSERGGRVYCLQNSGNSQEFVLLHTSA